MFYGNFLPFLYYLCDAEEHRQWLVLNRFRGSIRYWFIISQSAFNFATNAFSSAQSQKLWRLWYAYKTETPLAV